MSKAAAQSSLEVNDDPSFQRRFWIAQRISWLVFVAILGVAMLGLTGMGGPLSRAQAEAPAANVDYPRIARWQTNEQIRIHLAPSSLSEAELVLSPDFLTYFELRHTTPMPSRAATTAAGVALGFDRAPNEEAELVLHVRPKKTSWMKRHPLTIDESAATLAILVMP